MVPFRTDPLQPTAKENAENEYDDALSRMQRYFMNLFVEQAEFLFVELKASRQVRNFHESCEYSAFQFFEKTNENFFYAYFEYYKLLCKGFAHCKVFDTTYQQGMRL